MFRKRILMIAVLALLLTTTTAVPTQAYQLDNEKDWLIGEATGRLIANGSYTKLVNRTIRMCLGYKVRLVGINLGWRDCDSISPNIRLVRQTTGDQRPLVFGERLAIQVRGRGYLRYGQRTYGINLVWSNTPSYEWEIRGGAIGELVQTGMPMALYNRVEADTLIYCKRLYGINLRWTDDCPRAKVSGNVANAVLSLRIGPFPINTPGNCTGRVIWRLNPISLSGSEGLSTPQTIDRDYNVPPTSAGPNESYCYVRYTQGNLKLGSWEVSASTPLWSTSCTITLQAGNNSANFTEQRQGCVNGFGYPGE
jgi:hypothetical protein